MAYVTVENLPRPTRKRKWSSSATKATPSCHNWKREVGHNKFTSTLSQIKGYLHRELKLTTPKTVWSEFEVIIATTLCQYNHKTSVAVLTRSTLKQRIYDQRCFIGYVLQFSLPFLNLGNTSTSSTSWTEPAKHEQTAKQLDYVITVFGSEPIRHWLRKFTVTRFTILCLILERVEFRWNFDFL